MTGTRGRPLVVGIGLAVSACFLWFALRGVDVMQLLRTMRDVNATLVLLSAVLVALSIVVRSVRWRLLAGHGAVDSAAFFRATQLGVLSNLLFPGRVGEIVRVVALRQSLHCALSRPLISAFVDRLVDILVLVGCASVLFVVFPVGALLGKWLTVFVAVAVLAVIVLMLLAKGWGDRLLAWVAQRMSKQWSLQPEMFLVDLRSELRTLSRCWLRWQIPGVALLVLCIDYAIFLTLLQAFHQSLPPWAPLLLWVFLSAGSALPSAPGYIGVYQVASVWALSFFDVGAETAVGLATVLQGVSLATALLLAGLDALGWLRRVFPRGAA